jgi:hypothetical protein
MLTTLLASAASAAIALSSYSVTVTRSDANIYKLRSGFAEGIIETRYCYEYAYSDPAILIYDRYSSNNKIVFSSGTVCDVAGVYVR